MRITKTYVMKWRAVVKSSSPYHTERWFYDEKEEFVGGCIEHLNHMGFIDKTDLWLPGLKENMLIGGKDGFMKLNEIRERFYQCLLQGNNLNFFMKQHGYLLY